MADNTVLNPGVGGDTIMTEQPGGVGAKIPVTKLRVGAQDVDGGDVTPTNPFPNMIVDGAGAGTKTSVGAFHNSDNQVLPNSGGSILTGGVAQLTNPTGTADRARGTGLDATPAVGIPAGSANFAQKILTSVAGAIGAPGVQAVTPASMFGIQVGSILTYDVGGANQEVIFVTAITTTQFTANFTKTHPINSIVNGFIYNQERDAKGELDGADGTGTAVAAEYEYNGGSPGGGFFDRARNVQGKGLGSSTLNGAVIATATSIVLAAVVGLQPGQQLFFNTNASGAATPVAEIAYVAINYVPGQLTVPLQSPLVGAHANGDTVRWEVFAAAGPGLNGFYATGVGIEEEALWDPVSGQFFLERAATQDGVSPQNVVLETPGLWNGTTVDRGRSQSNANTTTSQAGALTGVELTDTPAGWSVQSSPAVATQATVTRAAGGAGVRHVCKSITVSLACGATPQTPINVYVRDGASGAGTILWSGAVAAPANGSETIAIPLSIAGSANTAMTIEFSAAGVAASLEAVSMTGYDVG